MRPRTNREETPRDGLQPRAGRTGRALLALERVLFCAGLVCLVVYVSACAERSLFQTRQAQDFDRSLAHALQAEDHDQSEWSEARVERYAESLGGEVEPLGRLEIPAADVSVMVLEGTDDETLDRAVGRIPGTAEPGAPGNLGIAGHRDGFFRGLRHVKPGDAMSFASIDGYARYEIRETLIVEPEAVEVLAPTDEPAITLVTCYPFYFVGNAPKRFIVRAYRTSFEPWTSESLARYTGRATTFAQRP